MKSLFYILVVSGLVVATCEPSRSQREKAGVDSIAAKTTRVGETVEGHKGKTEGDTNKSQAVPPGKLLTGDAGKEPGKGYVPDTIDKRALYDSIDRAVIRQKQLFDSLNRLNKVPDGSR